MTLERMKTTQDHPQLSEWQWQGINRVKPELAGSIAGDASAVSSNSMLSSSSEVRGEKSHLGVPLKDAIERDFGSLDNLQKQMNAQTAAIQGSGWGWLVRTRAWT